MTESVLRTCGRFALLASLLAASASPAFAEWGEVELSIDSNDIFDTKAFDDLVINMQPGGTPDGELNAVNVHYDAPTDGYSVISLYLEITCYDPSIRGLPQTEGRSFPGHAIRAGESNEPGLFCPENMRMVKGQAVVSLNSP